MAKMQKVKQNTNANAIKKGVKFCDESVFALDKKDASKMKPKKKKHKK